SALAGPLLALIARTGEALGSFKLENGERAQVADFHVAAGSSLVGRKLGELAEAHHAVVLAHGRPGEPLHFATPATATVMLGEGDTAVVCGRPDRVAPLLSQGENESLPELLWAGFVRRFARVAFRSLDQMDATLKVCTLLFVGVVVVSVLVFHLGMEQNT